VPEDPPCDRADLPAQLFARTIVPIAEHNPVELDLLARRFPALVPFPEDKHPNSGKASGYRNLAQYRGRSAEGNRRSMANLVREVKSMSEPSKMPVVIPGIPTPEIKTMKPPRVPGIRTMRGKFLKRVLAKDEYDLFVETWNDLWRAHKDEWDQPEDRIDAHAICMETVVMFRLEIARKERPAMYSEDAYNASSRRMQTARDNLAARRASRINSKAGGTSGDKNIMVFLSREDRVDDVKVKQVINSAQQDQEAFLKRTHNQQSFNELMAIEDEPSATEEEDQ
jgi:hypothetical protein